MAYEQKDGQGSLFKNDKKDTEQHPDYRGSITIGRREYWLSAWIKSSKAGQKYMSLSAQPKDKQPAPSSGETVRAAPAASHADTMSDDIPF